MTQAVTRLKRALRERFDHWRDAAMSSYDDLRGAAERASAAFKERDRLRVLTVVHAGGGGTIHTNEDLMRALATRHTCHILACGPRKWTMESVGEAGERVAEMRFDSDWGGVATPERLAAFDEALAHTEPDIVHFRSFLGSGPEFVPRAKQAGCATLVSFHDFLALCPNINLLDAELKYCAGQCTALQADCSAPAKWFANVGPLKRAYVNTWRARMATALPAADGFVTTSRTAANVLKARLPFLARERFVIIPHGRDLTRTAAAAPPLTGERMRVVALNISSPSKGQGLVSELIALNRAAGAPFEFHLLGGAWEIAPEDGVAHGAYAREDLQGLLAQIRPSISLIPSPWPETFSHTLTESWAAGIPVAASNTGALAERIGAHGGGWLLPGDDAPVWFALLQRVATSQSEWRARAEEIARISDRDTATMARDYVRLYRRIGARPTEWRRMLRATDAPPPQN